MSSQICNSSGNPEKDILSDETNSSSTEELRDIKYIIGHEKISIDKWIAKIKPSKIRYKNIFLLRYLLGIVLKRYYRALYFRIDIYSNFWRKYEEKWRWKKTTFYLRFLKP